MIIASTNYIHRATQKIRKLHNEGFPYVMVSYVEDDDIYYVGAGHEYGSFLATEHLIKLGHKRIAYICGQRGNVLSDLRQKVFIEGTTLGASTDVDGFYYILNIPPGA